MIEGIRIRNFQAHEKFSLKFDPGVTTIVGPSDAGKSSILRALYWCCFNKPSGRAFIREGADQCRVQVRVNGMTVERRRTGSENLYLLAGGKYKSFGTDPPARISDLLNLDQINFQWQHDNLFWFPLSPGQVARELNRIVDLSVIDRMIQSLSKTVRRSESEVQLRAQMLEDSRDKLEDLKWVRECDEELGKIERIEDRIAVQQSRIASLVRSLQQVGFYREVAERALEAMTAAQDLRSSASKVVEARSNLDRLFDLVRQIRHQQEVIEQHGREIQRLKRKMPKTCPLCGGKLDDHQC